VVKKKGKPETDAVKVMQEWMTQIKKRALWHLSPQFKYGRALLNDPVQERIACTGSPPL